MFVKYTIPDAKQGEGETYDKGRSRLRLSFKLGNEVELNFQKTDSAFPEGERWFLQNSPIYCPVYWSLETFREFHKDLGEFLAEEKQKVDERKLSAHFEAEKKANHARQVKALGESIVKWRKMAALG